MRQHAAQRRTMFGRNLRFQFRRKVNLQRVIFPILGEPSRRIRMAVGIWQIGLDIINRRAIH